MTNIGVTYFLLDINIAKKLNFVALFCHYSKYDACYTLYVVQVCVFLLRNTFNRASRFVTAMPRKFFGPSISHRSNRSLINDPPMQYYVAVVLHAMIFYIHEYELIYESDSSLDKSDLTISRS